MTIPTPIYRAVVIELERRRIALGMSMERLAEVAGLADRAYAKMVHPETSAGRVAQWPTLQRVVDVLFPDGFDVILKGVRGQKLTALVAKYHFDLARALNGKHIREHMSAIGKKATGRFGRTQGLPASRRRKIAKMAAAKRWENAQKISANRTVV